MEIRNIAIIAHVDHGKTTLTDALLRQNGMFEEGASMDSNDLEKERGITIYAKNTSLYYKGTKINIVDTPGHADFGSEVERVLRSIDDVILVVDAQEGPMPQTRFVLKKSLELGFQPIVVINKIDKKAARPDHTHEAVLELFLELGASNEQIDFPVVYAIGRDGVAKIKMEDKFENLNPLLDTIISKVHPANGKNDMPLKAQVFNLGYDNFLGRLAIMRVYEGVIKAGEEVFLKKSDGKTVKEKISKLFSFEGPSRKEVEQAESGDIVMIAGLPDVYIGETVCEKEETEPMPAITIDEPTISLNFLINNSPFAGREGSLVNNRQIRERLEKELEMNVGLKVDFAPDHFKVYGRGELHISILLEMMRREGFEVQVSQPQVIFKEIDGVKNEPYEEAIIDVKTKLAGDIINKLGSRRGLLMNVKEHENMSRLIFEIPTRGLLGYRGEFVVDTKGEGILSSRFIGFRPYAGDIERHEFGSMISMENGKVFAFSLWNLQDRGTLYINPNIEVYEGMIIGNVSKGNDLDVNPTKNKPMSNMRSSGNDEALMLVPPVQLSIERGLEIMKEDEFLEITPKSVRLRKKNLTKIDRARADRKENKADK